MYVFSLYTRPCSNFGRYVDRTVNSLKKSEWLAVNSLGLQPKAC